MWCNFSSFGRPRYHTVIVVFTANIYRDVFFLTILAILTLQLQKYETMFTVLLLCLVGIVVAQQPRPCTSPPQWEGRIFDSNEKQGASLHGRISYDSTYHRSRIVENIETEDDDFAFDVLTLFDAKIQFIYNLKYQNCSRSIVEEPWQDFGVLPDAQSFGEAYIGSSAIPSGALLITIWLGSFFFISSLAEYFPYI